LNEVINLHELSCTSVQGLVLDEGLRFYIAQIFKLTSVDQISK